MLILLVLLPLVEIWGLVKVGSHIGALNTVALVVVTAVTGASLARLQSMATVQRVQASFAAGKAPAVEMMESVMLFVAAILLLIPGFFSDSAGVFLLIPFTRRLIARRFVHNFSIIMPGDSTPGGPARPDSGHTIDGEYTRDSDNENNRLP